MTGNALPVTIYAKMEVTILAVLGIIMIILLALLAGQSSSKTGKTGSSKPKGKAEKKGPQKLRPCPLCETMLNPSQRIHSVVYPAPGGDKLMEIKGCPFCAPPSGTKPRKCPVCGKPVTGSDVVFARMFEKPGKQHVHVLGCPACRPGPRRKP